MSGGNVSFFKKLGYFFAGAGLVNAVAYKQMNAYLQSTQLQMQSMVDKKEAKLTERA